MKTCPYCREQVLDDATKCRYCHSSLAVAKLEPEKGDERYVTYILDKDLIRFSKFSISVLAIFVVVGAYFFGFKLEASVERVNTLQKEVEAASAELKKSQLELQSAKTTVTLLKADVDSTLVQARQVLGEISKQKEAAVAMVISIRELTPTQEKMLAQAKSSEPGKSIGKGKFWLPGANIRIALIGGTPKQKELVQQVAQEWLKYANLTFTFTDLSKSDVRVAFDANAGSWSFVGTDALGVAKKEPTMNLAWTERMNILHEFGHVLGLIEEHQNPNAGIKWNTALVRKELSGPPNFWSEDTIQERVLKVVPKDQLGEYRSFDPKSIMTYHFDARLTGGVPIGGDSDLSESDKKLVTRLYPK